MSSKPLDQKSSDLFRAMAQSYAEQWVSGAWSTLSLRLDECESPIEQRLLVALSFMEMPFYFDGYEEPYARPKLAQGKDALADFVCNGREEFAFILTQPKALNYRLDFCLIVKFEGRKDIHRIAIECDGHNFHERTKEQAMRDKARDRALVAAGIQVLRFTGSEIFRDAAACAKEVERWLRDLEYRTRPD